MNMRCQSHKKFLWGAVWGIRQSLLPELWHINFWKLRHGEDEWTLVTTGNSLTGWRRMKLCENINKVGSAECEPQLKPKCNAALYPLPFYQTKNRKMGVISTEASCTQKPKYKRARFPLPLFPYCSCADLPAPPPGSLQSLQSASLHSLRSNTTVKPIELLARFAPMN